MNDQGKLAILSGILFAGWVIYHYNVTVPETIKLQENHVVVCADIISYNRSYKVSDMKFHFIYKGKDFEFVKENTPKFVVQRFEEGKRNVMIVFETGNPNNWAMLGEDDNNYYNIEPKDTTGMNCNWD